MSTEENRFDIELDVVGKEEVLSQDEAQRFVESQCIAKLPSEIYVPESTNGYKDNPPLYNGIYRLGFEVIGREKLIISYYRRYIEKKEVVFKLEISRDIETVQTEIEQFLNYLEANNIEVFNTERFVKIFANFARNNLEPDMNVHGEKIRLTTTD